MKVRVIWMDDRELEYEGATIETSQTGLNLHIYGRVGPYSDVLQYIIPLAHVREVKRLS